MAQSQSRRTRAGSFGNTVPINRNAAKGRLKTNRAGSAQAGFHFQTTFYSGCQSGQGWLVLIHIRSTIPHLRTARKTP
ncbi:hypothetical protein [Neisseria sicca]|uniref:hypothetical protein n=1 Tax=Neisseria sicca TaxID=490 RepID=UPI0011BD00CA|nr:hypothetical protein [Neisseria sicca]